MTINKPNKRHFGIQLEFINVMFEPEEFAKLNAIRRKMTWRRFILKNAGLPYEVKQL